MHGQHRFCLTPAHTIINSFIQQILTEYLICAPFYGSTPSMGIFPWKPTYAGFHKELQCFTTLQHLTSLEPSRTESINSKTTGQERVIILYGTVYTLVRKRLKVEVRWVWLAFFISAWENTFLHSQDISIIWLVWQQQFKGLLLLE